MMFLSKVKVVMGGMLLVTALCTGAALFASGMLVGGPEQEPAAPVAREQEKAKPVGANEANRDPIRRRKEEPSRREFNDRGLLGAELEIRLKEELAGVKPDFRALGREKVNVAKEGLADAWDLYAAGASGKQQNLTALIQLLVTSLNNLLAAELEIASSRSERLAALERHWLVAKRAEIIGQANYIAGRLAPQDFHPLRYLRLDAEMKLLKAREGK